MIDSDEKLPIPQREAANRAAESFEAVFQHGNKIELDHFLVYYARKRSTLFSRYESQKAKVALGS